MLAHGQGGKWGNFTPLDRCCQQGPVQDQQLGKLVIEGQEPVVICHPPSFSSDQFINHRLMYLHATVSPHVQAWVRCKCVCVCVCVHVCICECMHTNACICTHAVAHIQGCKHTCMYTHTHTHTHTHTTCTIYTPACQPVLV